MYVIQYPFNALGIVLDSNGAGGVTNFTNSSKNGVIYEKIRSLVRIRWSSKRLLQVSIVNVALKSSQPCTYLFPVEVLNSVQLVALKWDFKLAFNQSEAFY